MPVCVANCCLCGAPIDETSAWPEWMGSFRAVCVLNERLREAFISGVGERKTLADRVPNPLRHGQNNTNGGQGSDEPLEPEHMEIDISSTHFRGDPAAGPRPLWGFPFHSSCWDFFNAARRAQEKPPYNTQVLFEVLMSFPRNELTDFGHNYGGVAGYSTDRDLRDGLHEDCQLSRLLPGEEPRLVYNRTNDTILGIQMLDPMHNAELRSVFENGEESARHSFGHRPGEVQPKRSLEDKDIFQRFPFEILDLIVLELSSPEVLALRQSSRVFRHLPLSEKFWRSRFLPGQEFECVFDALDDRTYDRRLPWSIVYQRLMRISPNVSLKNRRRVWKLSQALGDLYDKSVEGRRDNRPILPESIETNREPREDDVAWVRAGRCLRPFDQRFSTGSRVLDDHESFLRVGSYDMKVQVVRILSNTYVCGLRWDRRSPWGPRTEGPGYIRHREEVVLRWDHQDQPFEIVGFHLALDQHGVRGLCAVSSTNQLSSWAGDYHGLPKQRLMLEENLEDIERSEEPQEKRFRFDFGFDALKLVSLSSPVRTPGPTDTANLSTPSLRDVAPWYPDVPPPHLSFSGIGVRDLAVDDFDQHDLPLSMLMFGDYNGEHLKHMTRLTVLSQDGHGIMGLEATFDCLVDGKNTKFLGCTEPCKPLGRQTPPAALRKTDMIFEASTGEEISGLEILQNQYVLCFKVYTSRGRAVEFPSPDDSGNSMKARAEYDGEIIITFRPAFSRVVGFLARAGSRGLQNLGLVHIKSPNHDI